eukprot:g24447.t1
MASGLVERPGLFGHQAALVREPASFGEAGSGPGHSLGRHRRKLLLSKIECTDATVLNWRVPSHGRFDLVMAWKSKEAMVVVIDVGASMQETFSVVKDGSKVTRAQTALGVAQRLVQHRLFFTPKEEVGIVFFGTRDTQNDLQEDGEYRNIYVCRNRKIDVVDLEALRCLSETTAPKGGEVSDAVSALIVGLDMLIKRTKDRTPQHKYAWQELKYKKSIKLITHESSAPLGDPDLAECAKQLQVMGAELSVTLVGSSGKGAWAALQGEHLKVVSLPELLRDTELRVKPVEQRAKARASRNRSPSAQVRLALTISPEMDIPIGVYSKTTRVGFPTMKKQSKLAAAIPSEARKSDKVLPDRTYYATPGPRDVGPGGFSIVSDGASSNDQEGEEVKKEDRVKGFKYGQNIVPMSEYDEAALSYSCDRTLTTLGFADAASVSPESSLHSVDVVAADKGDAWAHYAFESLVEAMLSEKRVLIARYCFRKDSQPRMVALIPKKGAGVGPWSSFGQQASCLINVQKLNVKKLLTCNHNQTQLQP